jgi:hypothetical protein
MSTIDRVTPLDCVLAIAVPHTREQFLDDLNARSKDYAKSVASRYFGATSEYVWKEYEPTAKLIERVATEVASQGVRVQYDCQWCDLAVLLPNCKVLTLVAHMHFEPVLAADVIDASGLLSRLTQPDGELCRVLKDQIGDLILSQVWSGANREGSTLPGRVAELLNSVIDQKQDSHRGESLGKGTNRGITAPPLRLSRSQLEHFFNKELVTSRPIELADGEHTIDEFVTAIPLNYKGAIDLCMCHSNVLVELIKHRSRACTVITNRVLATPLVKLTRYKLVIHRLGRNAESYMDAVTRVYNRRWYC